MAQDSNTLTVGDALARYLAGLGVETAYGVLSIHHMPLLDALGRQGGIRYVCARGEAGVVGMADACARVTGRLGEALIELADLSARYRWRRFTGWQRPLGVKLEPGGTKHEG